MKDVSNNSWSGHDFGSGQDVLTDFNTVVLGNLQLQYYVGQRWKKNRPLGLREASSIDISRKIFEISRYNITNKTAYYFFEPLVQPFEHFKHRNTA